jgi:lysophospholipase L1-like esterase
MASQATGKKRTRWRAGLAAAALSVILGLGLSEGVLQLIDRTHPERQSHRLRYLPDPATTYRLLPRWQGGRISTNEYGFRERRGLPQAKPPGVVRIAAVGDSFTFGLGVAGHETFSTVLEELLAARMMPDDRRVEVLNFGVSGYNTTQELALLRDRVLAFEPDMVVLGWFINDFDDLGGSSWVVDRSGYLAFAPLSDRSREMGLAAVTPDTNVVWRALLGYSQLCRTVQRVMGRRAMARELGEEASEWWWSSALVRAIVLGREIPRTRSAWKRMEEALLAVGETLPTVFLLIPAREQVGRAEYHGPLRRVREFLAGRNLASVDLLAHLEASDEDAARFYLPENPHPSAAGHRLIAELLLAELERGELLR